jgi:quinoprotein glucose dehydrogenase
VLQVAWIFNTANLGPTPETNLESTPLVIDGVFYSTAGDGRDVVALDATTGELPWTHRLSGRGLAYWAESTPGSNDKRIIYFTTGYRMIALDAKVGGA